MGQPVTRGCAMSGCEQGSYNMRDMREGCRYCGGRHRNVRREAGPGLSKRTARDCFLDKIVT